MSESPVFSIIVPVYKVEAFLDKCVRSLTGQTFSDIEIILVDDGSPDRCPEMCDAYAREDARITVIHKPNGGLSDARNAGLEASRGRYVLFVDSDDYIAEDTCQRLLPFLRLDCDIVIGDGISEGSTYRICHGNTEPGQICTGKAYLKKALKHGTMPMAVWLCAYNRHFLQENELRFKVGIVHEDEHFTPRAFLAAERVTESGIRFYHYVIREQSITMRKDLRKNAVDLYNTCVQLSAVYQKLEDAQLRDLLLDSLSVKYLSLFQRGRLYRYGREYIHRAFVWNNARRSKTRCKALLYCLSPAMYWHINAFVKGRTH